MKPPVKPIPPYATYASNRREKLKYHSGIGHAKVALQSCLSMWENRNHWLKAHGMEEPFPTLELHKYKPNQGYGLPPGDYKCILTVGEGLTVEQLKQHLKDYPKE